MSVWDRFLGLVFAAVYALRRAKIGFLRLDLAAVVAALIAIGYAVYRGWVQGWDWPHFLVVLGGLSMVVLILLAETRRYVVFRARAQPATAGGAELAPEQKIFVRGSGNFEVSHMQRYLAEVPVVFWTTELADHVLAAKVRALRVLGVGVPKAERGWWYIFLDPPKVTEIVDGELCFGTRCRPAVRVQYATDKGLQAVYLSCDDAEQQRSLLSELRAKADAAAMRRGQSKERAATRTQPTADSGMS